MTFKYYLAAMLLTAAMLVATVIAYPHLPCTVVTHWDIHDQPNGYSAKWVLYLFGPGMMAGMMLIMNLVPWLSPKHFEVESFRSTYLQIMLIVVAMLAYFYVVVLWADLGHPLNVGRAIVVGMCLLFALLGNLIGKVRRNFYIGIRTPWTLANERVWYATHRFAAKTFVLGGLAGLALTAVGIDGWPVLAVVLTAALVPVLYSLIHYKYLERRGEL